MSVDKDADGWTFVCDDCGFQSLKHTSKANAEQRGQEHADEHETGVPMRTIGEFDAEHRR
jgi:hypothetical protein